MGQLLQSAWLRASRVIQQVSTKPTSSSYVWGGRISPLPFVAFHAVYLARLLSPLQWVKFTVRRIIAARPTTNMRPDFPSAYTEWYFLAEFAAVLLVFVSQDQLDTAPTSIKYAGIVLAGVMIFEINVWILYYLLLRGFLELHYTIFHPAEYLLTFPLVLTTQALLASLVLDRDLSKLLVDAVGNPQVGDSVGVGVAIATLFYLGVAITVVLSSHPGIRTRAPQNFVIVGAGDVTAKRIIPALKSLGYDRDDIVVVTVPEADEDWRYHIDREAARLEIAAPDRVMDTSLRERSPTIIASPTYVHFSQLVRLANAGIPFAVEKPISSVRSERDILRSAPELMERGFALSYYTLEKALPLTYFIDPLPIYARHLSEDRPGLISGAELGSIKAELGRIESITIDLLEGTGRSPHGTSRLWTELPGVLRSFVETAVHPLLILRHVTGSTAVAWDECIVGRYDPRARQIRELVEKEIAPTWFAARGRCGAIDVTMRVGKYVPDSMASRMARIEYENGRVDCDFDARNISLTVADVNRGVIAVDSTKYSANYSVLMSLFTSFSLNGWDALRFDDFQRQLDALDWWDDLCDRVEVCRVPVTSYEAVPPVDSWVSLSDEAPAAVAPLER
ncbi:hypothetical protein [Cryptosporangium aurantiacum]|uniref:Oxidoreductase family, NAD-binding Rossmann fold n=1 Tax=Cryptosporangium aurantiacum TaxID=134849 RepID=A0A1M7RIX0_9ACTN|nr:hypothetical protein [Cryptosporangium aurantiacum]SHN46237.1 hypothetical protein SAMN05443668_11470 [Cryptosporangium aurantiacum]